MTDPNDEPKTPSVNADHNSNAVGSISAGGNIGDIHIGNIYQTPEDDLPLSSDEIENGLIRFAQYLPERAPVLQNQFSFIAKKLRATLGADQNSLSPALKAQREDGVDRMKLMCMEVTDISFRAICLGQNPPLYDSRPPFLGLFAFRPEDREFFFGRDALVQKLVTRIKAHPFLAVLGASGSGKSSLVMAGLVPALEAQMSYLTPSSAPLSQLLTAKESASAKTVFVIDQFEELFTHPHDAAERADFIHALLELTKTNRVVITMRADFWGEVAIYSDLKQAMQEHQELIAPMNVDELHSAMEKQAAVVGLRFDPTLSESILAEVKGEPGAMPLLQHALWELWNRRHGLWIKAEEYQAFGGVKQAIASTAEEVYASCSDFERARVRAIFLRLTRLDPDGSGEGRDTRRRVLIEELIPVNSDSSVTIKLLNKLADARLIVKTDKDVEVAHEALIRHWSRLTEWLNEDRDNLRLREGVSESAREWENSKRDDSLLNHRGGRLELALAMSKLPRYQLNPIEQAYLNACVSLRNKEQRERERRLRFTVIASIVAAVIFLVLGSFGLVKSNEAVSQAGTAQANANAAETAKANAEIEKQNAVEQAAIARAGELAAQANLLRKSDFELSMLLSIEAFSTVDTPQSKKTLLDSILLNSPIYSYNHLFNISNSYSYFEAYKAAYSFAANLHARPDNDGKILLWNLETGIIERTLSGNPSGIAKLAFSVNGNLLAAAGNDDTVTIWDTQTGKAIGAPQLNVNIGNSISDVMISPDEKTLLSIFTDKSIFLWDIEKSQLIGEPLYGFGPIAFSHDGKELAVSYCEADDIYSCETLEILIWNIETSQLVGKPLTGLTTVINDIVFSADDKFLFSSSNDDNFITKWDLSFNEMISQKPIGDTKANQRVTALSQNGKYALSVGCSRFNRFQVCDQTMITLLDLENQLVIDEPYFYDTSISEISFNSDSKSFWLADFRSDSDTAITLWSTEWFTDTSPLQPIAIKSLQLNPDGRSVGVLFDANSHLLAMTNFNNKFLLFDKTDDKQPARELLLNNSFYYGSGISDNHKVLVTNDNGTAVVWDVETNKPIGAPYKIAINTQVVLNPKGDTLVTSSGDGIINFWDIKTQQLTGQTKIPNGGLLWSGAFSPDGKILALSLDNILLIDTETHKIIGEILGTTYTVNSLTFSPDGTTLVSGNNDGSITIFDLKSRKLSGQVEANGLPIQSVAISPNGEELASLTSNGEIIIWDLNAKAWIKSICERAGRNLTWGEWQQYMGSEPYRVTCPNSPAHPTAIIESVLPILLDVNENNRVQIAIDAVEHILKESSSSVFASQQAEYFVKDLIKRKMVPSNFQIGYGNIEPTLLWLENANKIGVALDEYDLLNEICWYGSIYGYARDVLEYCEQGVVFFPEDFSVRDSRGLARALTNDYEGAILDFQYYVDHSDESAFIEQRKQWIRILKNDINPFTVEVLETLKDQ